MKKVHFRRSYKKANQQNDEGCKAIAELFACIYGTNSGRELKVGMPIAIEMLGEMAMRDTMTGLFNRNFIEQRLPAEISGSINQKSTFSLLMADLDDFKMVNDTFGHVAADEVLKRFAKVLLQAVRDKDDWAARYGGDEFLLFLRGMDKEDSLQIAERIRSSFEKEEFSFGKDLLRVTVSIGVHEYSSVAINNAREIIMEADKKLYEAKQTGKNRVC